MIQFNFNKAEFDYEPYPVCYIPNFFDDQSYKQLSETYPDLNRFRFEKSHGNKYSITELEDPKVYFKFLKENPVWQELYNKIKTQEFVEQVRDFLISQNIDLGLKKFHYTPDITKRKRSAFGRLKDKKLIRSKMEFVTMPASGGNILPHTDHRLKYVTLVFSMVKPGEWNQQWGGGTDALIPKDRSKIFNQLNRQGKFEDMEIVKTYPFQANQCLLFIKTYNSWHSVTPMVGPESGLRKTLTVNIEGII